MPGEPDRTDASAAPLALVPAARRSLHDKTIDLLCRAKRTGLDDAAAAAFAGMTLDDLRGATADDPALGVMLQQARSEGLVARLDAIKDDAPWQGQQYVIETFWCSELGVDAQSEGGQDMIRQFSEVSQLMTPEQKLRAADLLELGRLADNARESSDVSSRLPRISAVSPADSPSASSCSNAPSAPLLASCPTRLPAPPPPSSNPPPPSLPSANCGGLSSSRGA